MDKKIFEWNELKNKIAVVVGTRPGIIKFSPIIKALKKHKVNYFVVHSGQHYSYSMDRKFFEDLGLPEPRYKIDAVKKYKFHGGQTAKMLMGLEKIFIKERPKIVIVGGDANTNLAGALAARKLGIKVAHIEAGLRSDDWRMPEEHNRVMIDHISDYLFPPTSEARTNLIKDNVKGKIIVTGNTIVDAVYQNLEIAQKKSNILNKLSISANKYFLLTLHREENVDSKNIFTSIINAIRAVNEEFPYPIIFPVHPRTKKRIKDFKLLAKIRSIKKLRLIAPLGYLDFLLLLSNTRIVMADSGGVQEEACILHVPCVTLRENTERPETVRVRANLVAGTDKGKVLDAVRTMMRRKAKWRNPFGDGKAGERIVKVCLKEIS